MPVYFIRAGEDGPVKIGTADDALARLRELQCGNHLPLTLLRQISGAAPEELWLHRHFASLRVRGEWFRFDASMMAVEPPTLVAPPETPFANYLSGRNISDADFAEKIGVTSEAVRLWRLGHRSPRSQQLLAILDATGGMVTPNDFLRGQTPAAHAGSKPSSRRSA